MSIHKLIPERGAVEPSALSVGLNFDHKIYDFAETVVKTRAIRALDNVAAKYPVYRYVRCASRRKLHELFDDFALHSGLSACRFSVGSLLLEGPGIFVEAEGWRTPAFASCGLHFWADSVARFEEVRDRLFQLVGHWYARDRMFTLDWYYMSGHGLDSTSFDELATDEIHDEAYPTLGTSVHDFICGFLDADETVLLLLGPPGVGKTRLVRTILGAMSLRKGDSAKVMYTADKRALEHDEIFVNFVTRSHDAFVIEDADHMLMARSSGNHDLHRFLAIADGVVRAQGRKIIFTSNLPNISDVDEALLRPGRCYASVRTRLLNRDEAAALLNRLVDEQPRREALLSALFPEGVRGVSVANVYQAAGKARRSSGAQSPYGSNKASLQC